MRNEDETDETVRDAQGIPSPAKCPHIPTPCGNATLPEDFQELNHSSPNSIALNLVVKRPILTKGKTMALVQISNKHVSKIFFNALIKEGTNQ